MEYLLPLMFEGNIIIRRQWRVWIPSIKNIINSPPESFDLCVAVLPKMHDAYFAELCDIKSQEYVRQMIDISGSWNDIISKFNRNKKQVVSQFPSKYAFSYDISNDPNDFEIFYYRMYLPHIKRQFGVTADIDSYEDMISKFKKGFLLLVTYGNEKVGGCLCVVEQNKLYFRRQAVLDGDYHLIKSGVQLAMYYYVLKIAKERDFKVVDYMHSRPFLNDGVYRTKRSWGATVYPDDESKTWVYFFNSSRSPQVSKFFEMNPVIYHAKDGLRGLIGEANGMESCVSTSTDKNLLHQYHSPGISGLTFITAKGELLEIE
jgi:hypothetical protein